MKISDIYEGVEKTCPRCKGHKYILGQKKTYSDSTKLPNYRHIERGICFLCDGKGTAFHTLDNRVLKLVKTKTNKNCIIEFSPFNGKKMGIIPVNENEIEIDFSGSMDIQKSSNIIEDLLFPSEVIDDISKDVCSPSTIEEWLFPNTYGEIWCDDSKVADVIMKEYPNARAIAINEFYDFKDDYCINFLLYYDMYGNPIKPFYIQPPHDDVEESYKGIVMLSKDYVMGVSGTYSEKRGSVYFGIKTIDSFRILEVENVKSNMRKFKSLISSKREDVNLSLDNAFCKKIMSAKILNDAIEIASLNGF